MTLHLLDWEIESMVVFLDGSYVAKVNLEGKLS